jgi:hypothetical protein
MGIIGDYAAFAHDAEEMVRNTPTAADLKKLYERTDTGPPSEPTTSQ